MALQIAQQLGELILVLHAHAIEQSDDPLLVLTRHAPELFLAFRGQLHPKYPPVGGIDSAVTAALCSARRYPALN